MIKRFIVLSQEIYFKLSLRLTQCGEAVKPEHLLSLNSTSLIEVIWKALNVSLSYVLIHWLV